MSLCFEEVSLTPDILNALIRFSADWEAENSCHGYRGNAREDIEGRRIFLAKQEGEIVAYGFGLLEEAERENSIYPKGTKLFELEELYVIPAMRKQGVGKALFSFIEEKVSDQAEMLMVSTATKNHKAILHFYLEEVGMEFWSARLYKPLKK